jgi:ABC-2 type transport system permease protein
MNKIFLIIQREYLARVKKKSFIIMTLIGPLLISSIMIIPVWLSTRDHEEEQKIEVIDESFLFRDSIPQNKNLKFVYSDISLDKAQDSFYQTGFTAILYIPSNVITGGATVKLFYKVQPGVATEEYIQSNIEEMIYNFKLQKNNVDIKTIKDAHTVIHLITEKVSENGSTERTSTATQMGVGYVLGFLIYMFIFLYGAQVMRGVIEEKTSRIVEVIISSVRPFELMMGKIIGVALVGLTQFLLWLVITFSIYTAAQSFLFSGIKKEAMQKEMVREQVFKKGANLEALRADKPGKHSLKALEALGTFASIDFVSIVICFLFYFLAGYLMYSALFAAIGAAVDSETDIQQFMLPITIPLVLSLIMAQTIMQEPNSSLSFWFSIIPLTSPVVMMVRLPFGVPWTELALSMLMLVIGFIFTTWLAARIYKTGILMYGKKVSYRELWKWLFYKG